MRKAKTHLELSPAKEVKDNTKVFKFVDSKRKSR